jgi:cytochrome c oxidase subunit 4
MSKEENYPMYARTAIILLILTALNIFLASLERVSNKQVVILLICSLQAYIVLNWFMHLKFDNKFLKYLVLGIFIFFFVIIVITFLDYKFR